MKKLFILLALTVAGCITSALGQDVLYLKNGSIIKGELVKALPNEKIQFQLSDGTILSYDTTDAIMITKENANETTGKRDVVSLTNGSIIRGYLTEYIFDKKAVIKTSDGSLFVYNANEIAQVNKEPQTQAPVTTTKEYNYASSTATSNNTSNSATKEYRFTPSRSSRQDNDGAEMNRREAKRGYRGFVAFSPGYYISGIDAYEISTTHGFQINHNFFVGGGLGIDIIGLADMVAVPIYAAFNGNAGSHVAQFTYGSRIGLSIIDSYVPFMWNVNVGLRLGFTPTFGLSITPDFSLLASSDFFDARIGLRIGIDF